MASHPLIDSYLAGMATRLPADSVDELADGLIETWQHHLARGLTPTAAARTAIAEFGTPHRIVDEFVAQAPGRRTARLLLATGPVVGGCWGASLIAGKVWTWPIQPLLAAAYALALLAVVLTLLAAGTTRHSYRRTRLGTIGALTLVVLDAAMITAVAVLTPLFAWPMAVAIPASLARIGLTIQALPKPRTG